MTETQSPEFRECNTQDIVRQVGMMNVLAISGGRIEHRETGITMKVGSGYSVTIDLDWNDTYVVRQVFKRGAKTWVKGERREVYCTEVGEVAYKASCFHNNYDPKEW